MKPFTYSETSKCKKTINLFCVCLTYVWSAVKICNKSEINSIESNGKHVCNGWNG